MFHERRAGKIIYHATNATTTIEQAVSIYGDDEFVSFFREAPYERTDGRTNACREDARLARERRRRANE